MLSDFDLLAGAGDLRAAGAGRSVGDEHLGDPDAARRRSSTTPLRAGRERRPLVHRHRRDQRGDVAVMA